jgi:glycosyltransferase involved in cell wall biosynthesis
MQSVSVVMPVRDDGERVRTALRSARAALDSGGEIVVVDNESRDGTAATAAEFADVLITMSGTVGACRFAGVNASSSELIFFLDADQFLLPETISAAVEALERDNACAVIVPERPARDAPLWLTRLLIAERTLTEAVGAGIPRLITRDAYRQIFPAEPQVAFAEDWPLARPPGKVAVSDVPILHEEPESLIALLAKYVRYGRRAAGTHSNTVETFGISSRLLAFIRPSGRIEPLQYVWLVPVLALKAMKCAALMLGYALGRLDRLAGRRRRRH